VPRLARQPHRTPYISDAVDVDGKILASSKLTVAKLQAELSGRSLTACQMSECNKCGGGRGWEGAGAEQADGSRVTRYTGTHVHCRSAVDADGKILAPSKLTVVELQANLHRRPAFV